MRIEYHEATAIARLPGVKPGRPMCLDDWHKLAWRLFCGGKNRYQGRRPFVFRIHPLDAERMFILVRSERAFAHAQPRWLDIEAGQRVVADLCYVPARRPGGGGRAEITPRSERWPEIERHTLARAGVEVESASRSSLMGYFKLYAEKSALLPVVHASRSGKVADEAAFAQAFLHGIGRKRGYGMGTIMLPAPEAQASRVAA